jgi:hypothetical protein
LFKKEALIEQAMLTLYEQIKVKGLCFFCPVLQPNKLKYIMLKPGPTIQDVFTKYGREGYLILLYSDEHLGMEGLLNMEKWMIRILIFVAAIWLALYLYTYYLSIQSHPPSS